MTLYDDHDLRLLSGCITPHAPNMRLLPEAFRRVIALLREHGVPHVIAGRVALARYCRAQYTKTINVRVMPQEGSSIPLDRLSEMLDVALVAHLPVRCDVGSAEAAIEDLFAARSIPTDWLDTFAHLAAAEHLLWLALSADDLQSEVDAVHLIQSGHIDQAAFAALCRDRSPHLSMRLSRAHRRAVRNAGSDYSETVQRRLAERSDSWSTREGSN